MKQRRKTKTKICPSKKSLTTTGCRHDNIPTLWLLISIPPLPCPDATTHFLFTLFVPPKLLGHSMEVRRRRNETIQFTVTEGPKDTHYFGDLSP